MGWGFGTNSDKVKDDMAGEVVEEKSRLFGKVVGKLDEQGKKAAADNITKNAGRADSPEVLADRRSRGKGGGQSR
ncbi:hypothetical protein OG558_09725 [Kribbella sp. NBC_01510]|uniref:hypothetical protein n=1 Tax=Kribbella sp. NBC_01510 TaxID=2903581 RepID=UPI0038679347